MVRNPKVQYEVFGGGIGGLVVALGCGRLPSPEELARPPLDAPALGPQEGVVPPPPRASAEPAQRALKVGGPAEQAAPGASRTASPQKLARNALEAAGADERELAAVELEQVANNSQLPASVRAEATQHLRAVLTESQSPPVRAACIQGLASRWDYDSMPAPVDALDDPSDLVRTRAAVAFRADALRRPWQFRLSLRRSG
jgi:hypothetical protein